MPVSNFGLSTQQRIVELEIYRRPQQENQLWNRCEEQWEAYIDRRPKPDRQNLIRYHHAGRIMEDHQHSEAAGPCEKCVVRNRECRVYHGVEAVLHGSTCAACRVSNCNCSLSTNTGSNSGARRGRSPAAPPDGNFNTGIGVSDIDRLTNRVENLEATMRSQQDASRELHDRVSDRNDIIEAALQHQQDAYDELHERIDDSNDVVGDL
ncbi:uncharacterized protein J3D65DRAFT_607957 [Phyllosticta citribraziliensis]|uniref:Zn(2)-C6 fungal-type domain-containing protein n=1 Tax=Phyllosticta citribraziliensis TaxID=989973 RepID=A0ABR1L6H8_9PEZI